MDNFWLGRYVCVNYSHSPRNGQRAQVVGAKETMLVLRYGDGWHSIDAMSTVRMDPDQTTPVWPSAPIRVGDYVNVKRPDIGGTTRGRVTSQTICADYHFVDVAFADGTTGEVRCDQVTLSADQTTPL